MANPTKLRNGQTLMQTADTEQQDRATKEMSPAVQPDTRQAKAW
jgi:hypothetical protein